MLRLRFLSVWYRGHGHCGMQNTCIAQASCAGTSPLAWHSKRGCRDRPKIGVRLFDGFITYDWQGVTARPGARFGPSGIRQGSRRIFPGAGWNIYTG